MNDVIFWTSIPSHHSMGVFAELSGHRHVLCVCDSLESLRRKNQGWTIPDLGNIDVWPLDRQTNPDAFVRQIYRNYPGSVSVISGFHGCRAAELAWKWMPKKQYPRPLVCCERPDSNRGIKKWLQTLYYTQKSYTFGRRITGLLAIGTLSEEAYRRFGFPEEKIFPFLYTFSGKTGDLPETARTSLPIRMVYVGSDVPRKGIDLLLNAISVFSPKQLRLTLIGTGTDGPNGRGIKRLYETGLVEVRQTVPGGKMPETLSQYDILILPSRHDGWGMTVTEALVGGIGVLASGACGSSELVRSLDAGMVFSPGSVESIRDSVSYCLTHPDMLDRWKENARQGRSRIMPAAAAEYLDALIDFLYVQEGIGERPVPPWRTLLL